MAAKTRDSLELRRVYFRARPEVHRGLRIVSAKQGVSMEILLDRMVCEALPSLGGPRIAPRLPAAQSA